MVFMRIMENALHHLDQPAAQSVAHLVLTWADNDHRPRVLLGPSRRLIWANRAAEAELHKGSSLRLEGGRVATRRPDMTAELERITAIGGPDRARIFVPLADGTDHLIIDTARLPSNREHVALQFRPGTAKLFDPDEALRPFGLTPAERDVAAFLLEGATAREIASARRSAPDTVRAQVKSIYAKLGIGSRTELLRRLIPYFC